MSRPVVIAVASFTYAERDSQHSNCIDDLKSACFVPQHFADLVCESRGSSRGRYLYYQNFWISRMPFPTKVTRDQTQQLCKSCNLLAVLGSVQSML